MHTLKHSGRFIISVLTIIAVLFSIAACGGGNDNNGDISNGNENGNGEDPVVEHPEIGGTLIRALYDDPIMFNPILSTDHPSSAVESHIFQALVKYDENMQIVGELAYDWEISADGSEWVFYLEEDVVWHDGTPFTAEDVEFTIGTVAFDEDYPGPYASVFNVLADIIIVDDHTIKFILNQPVYRFLNTLVFGIIPKHIFCPVASEEYDVAIADMLQHPRNLDPIGTGPYTFGNWIEGEYIEVVRNTLYWKSPKPYIEVVLWTFPSDPLSALEAGEIDLLYDIPLSSLNRMAPLHATHNFFEYQRMIYDCLIFNFTDEAFKTQGINPFQNHDVRMAIAHALNRPEMIVEILDDQGVVMNSHYPGISWAHSEAQTEYGYSPETAAQLLDDAGWLLGTDGWRYHQETGAKFQFTLLTQSGNPRREQIAQLTKNYLEDVGIQVDVKLLEWGDLLNDHLWPGNFQMVAMGWTTGADPDAFSLFHTNGSLNFGKYSNTELDQLILQGRDALDFSVRQATYNEIDQKISADLPVVFLFSQLDTIIVDQKVKDITIGAWGLYDFESWYIDQE